MVRFASQSLRFANVCSSNANANQSVEFIKIVDSHVLLSSPAAPDPGAAGQGGDGSSAVGATVAGSLQATTPLIPVLQIVTPANLKTASDGDHPSEQLLVLNDPNASEEPSDGVVDKEDAIHRRNLQLWAHEWKLIDTFRSGSVGYEELRLFLRSCGSAIRPSDLMRFLEMYGDPAAESALQESANGEDTTFVLTKAGFLKFRHEYTKKEFAAESDRGLDSDYEGDDDAEDHIVKIQEHSARFETIQGMGSEKDSDGTNATNDDDKRRVVQHDGTVVQDQRVLDHSDESELDDEGDNGLE